MASAAVSTSNAFSFANVTSGIETVDFVIDNFIGGDFKAPVSATYAENTDPATGKRLGAVAVSGAEDVQAAVAAASAAQADWGRLSTFQRRKAVKVLAKVLLENAEHFARAESADMGKVLGSSAGDDLKRQIRNLRYHAEAATHQQGNSSVYETDSSFEKREEEAASKTYVNYVERHPVGVVAIIGHWSRPLHQIVWRMAPALVAGNTVVVKPPSCTPLTTYLLAQACKEAEIPAGVVNMLFGPGDKVGQALAAHPAVGALAMVGGPEAATAIQIAAAPTIGKKLKFDLGNNHAMVVMKDANLDALLPVVLSAAFTCDAGQRAHSLGRLFLHADIADAFTARLVEATKALKLGDPLNPNTDVGPMVHKEQVRRMQQAVDDLTFAGGKVLVGGTAVPPENPELKDGNWFPPTLIGGFTAAADGEKAAIVAESQGPVVKILTFQTVSEAVTAANAGNTGLSASLWSGNVNAAHTVAHALEAGYVWVNNWLARDLSMPFGGWKSSGNGQRSGGAWDVDFYSYTKTVCLEVSGRHALSALDA